MTMTMVYRPRHIHLIAAAPRNVDVQSELEVVAPAFAACGVEFGAYGDWACVSMGMEMWG